MRRQVFIGIVMIIIACATAPCAVFGADMAAKADDIKYVDRVVLDIDRDGVVETITLVKEPSNDYAHDLARDARMEVEHNGVKFTAPVGEDICFRSSGVEGFANPDAKGVSFAGVITSDPYIEDRWKLILFSFDGKKISRELTLYSSHPNIVVDGKREGGKTSLVVTTEDYDNDPARDKFLTTYEYSGGRWRRASIFRTKTGKYLKTKGDLE